MPDDIHFYEPANGHGLPHDPFNAIVGPRPIGWISSQDATGQLNLAPYSFFNAFNYIPPIIGFSSVGRKDSLNNIEQTGEFVWNLATRPLAEQMNQSCAMVAPEVNEFELAGLTTVASKVISVPRVAESPVSFECKVTQIIQLQRADGETGRRITSSWGLRPCSRCGVRAQTSHALPDQLGLFGDAFEVIQLIDSSLIGGDGAGEDLVIQQFVKAWCTAIDQGLDRDCRVIALVATQLDGDNCGYCFEVFELFTCHVASPGSVN